ncbi:MAG: SAM-dependent methyltransferase [Deltaproteobacteria bacterium HGW-Deltaproteobacteria-14]|jgi:SAM-dependent methyltransferase|nr:MAG: SAM-dependent methyltransferase [Deltaproteobacteria bacterium HGW-Deltaproteobacteria-14]
MSPTTSPSDPRRFAPATDRNKEPILSVLREVLPEMGLVLEIAAGTGQHAAFFAPHFPGLRWQPTDRDADSLASIAAWRDTAAAPNLLPPLRLDAAADAWPVGRADAIFNANMIHISPWAACLGLLRGAGRTLEAGGPLVLYGPYMLDGEHTAPSNAAFDASLRGRDPAWGVRDLADVRAAAEGAGLAFVRRIAMPANNQIVVFERQA